MARRLTWPRSARLPRWKLKPDRAGLRSLQQSEPLEIALEARGVRELNGLHPDASCALHVARRIIDEETARRFTSVAIEEQAKDRRIGFQQPLLPGNDNALELAQEGEAGKGLLIFLARKIGEREKPDAFLLQGREERDAGRDLARDHLLPALVEGPDLALPFRVARDELPHGLGEGAAAILLQIPGGRADIREKPLHALFVGEEVAVEMAGVPIEEDVADVENDGVDP